MIKLSWTDYPASNTGDTGQLVDHSVDRRLENVREQGSPSSTSPLGRSAVSSPRRLPHPAVGMTVSISGPALTSHLKSSVSQIEGDRQLAQLGIGVTKHVHEGRPGTRQSIRGGRVFIHGSDLEGYMSGLAEDLDAIAAAGGYDDTDAVVEEAVRELLRRRPELRLSLAVEKYRTGTVSLNRAAELAGVSAEAFKAELADRGIDRDAGFLDDSSREDRLETLRE